MPEWEKRQPSIHPDRDPVDGVREGFDQLIEELRRGPSERVETYRSLVSQFHTVSLSFADGAIETDAVYEQPLPDFFTPLPDDQHSLCGRLEAAMCADGIEFGEETLGSAQGTSRAGRVTIRPGMDSTNRVLTLLHEYAHQLLPQKEDTNGFPLSLREGHAEAVGYVVAHSHHVSSPDSADYLWYWQVTPEGLLAARKVVERTASLIVRRVGLARS